MVFLLLNLCNVHQVYDAAAVLAKYLETPHFASKDSKGGNIQGQKLIELGAGTGVVGMLAGINHVPVRRIHML